MLKEICCKSAFKQVPLKRYDALNEQKLLKSLE